VYAKGRSGLYCEAVNHVLVSIVEDLKFQISDRLYLTQWCKQLATRPVVGTRTILLIAIKAISINVWALCRESAIYSKEQKRNMVGYKIILTLQLSNIFGQCFQ